MKTWARCDVCGKVVRVRRDNGCLWVHAETWNRYYVRCTGSGFKPTNTYQPAHPRNPRLACFVAQRGWPGDDELSVEQRATIVQNWLGYTDAERTRLKQGGMP